MPSEHRESNCLSGAVEVRWGAPPESPRAASRGAPCQGARIRAAESHGAASPRSGRPRRDQGRRQGSGWPEWIGGADSGRSLAGRGGQNLPSARPHRLESTHRQLGRQLGIGEPDVAPRRVPLRMITRLLPSECCSRRPREWVCGPFLPPRDRSPARLGSCCSFGGRCARVRATASPDRRPHWRRTAPGHPGKERRESADGSVRVIVARTGFDQAAKAVGQNRPGVVLMEHIVLVEAVLRGLAGSASCAGLFDWLVQPGVSELERIPGKWSYSLV